MARTSPIVWATTSAWTLHDPGDIAWYNPDPVEPTMAFSCEPGVDPPGEFGVRVEDLVIVTGDGCEILNSDNKELEILGL